MPGEEDEGGFDVLGGDDDIDAGIESHLDGAIEAQDGPSEGTTESEGNDAPPTVEGEADGSASGERQDRGTDGSGAQDTTQQPVQQQAERTGPPVKSDDKGNLVDRSGNIVVKAGSERRFFETAQRYGRQAQDLQKQVETLNKQIADSSAITSLPKEYNLDNDEVRLGLQVAKSLRDAPVQTAQWALREVMKMGHTFESIVGGQNGAQSMQMDALSKMIDEKINPLLQPQREAQERAQRDNEVRAVYNEFLQKHPHSNVHQGEIAQVMQRGDKPNAEVAYWRLREYATRNGLDFTKPLPPQIEARRQGVPQPQQNGHAQPAPNAPQRMPSTAPMPNGGARPAPTRADEGMSHPDANWDEIIAQSMRSSGMQ